MKLIDDCFNSKEDNTKFCALYLANCLSKYKEFTTDDVLNNMNFIGLIS